MDYGWARMVAEKVPFARCHPRAWAISALLVVGVIAFVGTASGVTAFFTQTPTAQLIEDHTSFISWDGVGQVLRWGIVTVLLMITLAIWLDRRASLAVPQSAGLPVRFIPLGDPDLQRFNLEWLDKPNRDRAKRTATAYVDTHPDMFDDFAGKTIPELVDLVTKHRHATQEAELARTRVDVWLLAMHAPQQITGTADLGFGTTRLDAEGRAAGILAAAKSLEPQPPSEEGPAFEPIHHMVGDQWLLTIEEEQWAETRAGVVLAVHLVVENLSDQRALVPEFSIASGAMRRSTALDAECASLSLGLSPIPGAVLPRAVVDGWLIAPLAPRFSGGRPGYVVNSVDVSGNWRGMGRGPDDEPRDRRDDQAADIADGLSHWYWWGGNLLDELRSTERMYQRDPQHWIDNLGRSPEAAREVLFRKHREDHQKWAHMVTTYLRDRIGQGWADRFDGERNSTDLESWVTAQQALLNQYLTEFRALAVRKDNAS